MKKIKVFQNGKRLRDVYPYATKFQVFKFKLAKFVRKVVVTSFIIGLIAGAYQVGKETTSSTVVQAEDTSREMLEVRIDTLKDKVVSDIQKCESAGHKESDGLIVFDSNKKASLGTMQFQIDTVIHYYSVLYKQKITKKEAALIALDDEKATSLAKDIMFKDSKGWRNWFNCGTKIGAGNQIEIIKNLEK